MTREFQIKTFVALIFLSVSMFLWAQKNTPEYFDQLLYEANNNKSASKQVFDNSLEQLQTHRNKLSSAQQEYLDYLLIFNLIHEGRYNKATKAFESLFNQAETTFVKVRTQSSLSNLYAFNRDYMSTFRALQYVTAELSNLEDKELKHTIYLATANSYLLTDRFQISRDFSEVLLKDDPEPFNRCRALVYRQIADLALNNQTVLVDAVFFEIFELCHSQKQYAVSDLVALRWYEYQFQQLIDNDSKAETKRLISLVDKTGSQIDAQQFKSILTGKDALLAQLYLAEDSLSLAGDYAQKVINDSSEFGNTKNIQKAFQVLETIARRQNDFAMAYDYLKKRSEVESALQQDALDKEVAFASVQHKVLAKELQLQQLNKSNELLTTQAQLDAQNSWNQKLMLAWLVLVVALLAYWIYRAAKKRKELEILVELDHLTKILNRKGLENHVNQLITRKAVQRQSVHLAIMDLDHFKKVNDQCGHLIGDWVLKHVVYNLKKSMVNNMILGRLGGEEFAIVSSDLDNREMFKLMDEMRRIVKNLDYSKSEHDITLTASFGVASTETAGYSLQMLLTQADLALYEAKNKGRNQTITYQRRTAD